MQDVNEHRVAHEFTTTANRWSSLEVRTRIKKQTHGENSLTEII